MTRRKMIISGLAGLGGVTAAGRLAAQYGLVPPDGGGIYGPGATLNYATHRLLTAGASAREFAPQKISKTPYPNGKPPKDEIFVRQITNGFADWRLEVGGMVERPCSLSIAEIKGLPASSQITQLVCEEGWSYVAEWKGVALSHVLKLAGVSRQAKFVVYETLPIKGFTFDSIDIEEAMHPQTLISYGMNGADMPIEFGGPLRMRLPRQLGYKSVKYIAKVTATDSLKGFGKGLGSMDAEYGYSWYAGI